MSKNEFKDYLEFLLEKHIPIYFMNYEYINNFVDTVCKIKNISRREILILSYTIGANADECNKLLEIKGYSLLYVKKREDAIWKFALDNHTDCNAIIDKIFPQNADEKNQ